MEFPTFQSVCDDCMSHASALYNSRHDAPRMVALGAFLTNLLASAAFIACIGIAWAEGLSTLLLFLTFGQLMLSVLLMITELPQLLPAAAVASCIEGDFGFLSNAFFKAILYFYLGASCIPLGHLIPVCYIAGGLLLVMGVLVIVFRKREAPPQGEVLPNY